MDKLRTNKPHKGKSEDYSKEVYVGNIDTKLNEDDIFSIFADFEGLELKVLNKNNSKCYCFLLCKSLKQVCEIVKSMQNIKILDRNLIVRAADQELHKMIMEDNVPKTIFEKTTDNYSSKDLKNDYSHEADSANHTEIAQGKNKEHSQAVDEDLEKTSYYFRRRKNVPGGFVLVGSPPPDMVSRDQNKQFQNYQDSQNIRAKTHETSNTMMNSLNKDNHHAAMNQYVPSRHEIGCISDHARNNPSIKEENEQYDRNSHFEKSEAKDTLEETADDSTCDLFAVSVLNFPFYTTEWQLYQLFEECNPVDITMINNRRKIIHGELVPTEAIIFFESKDNVTKAIIEHDNTVYKYRDLIVQDIEDEYMEAELREFRALRK